MGCTAQSPYISIRYETSSHHSHDLQAASRPVAMTPSKPVRRYDRWCFQRSETSGSGGQARRLQRAILSSARPLSDQSGGPFPFFFSLRLEAVRCALRCVASIISTSDRSPSRANSVRMRANTPLRLQRTHLLYSVLGGPYSGGASRHLKPLRLMNISPLRPRLSSTAMACRATSERRAQAVPFVSLSARINHSYHRSIFGAVVQMFTAKSMSPEPSCLPYFKTTHQ